MTDRKLPNNRATASRSEVDTFVDRIKALGAPGDRRTGRILFALDATASRQPTWDRACRLQAEMFDAALGHGGLMVKLAFYRGIGECKVAPWLADGGEIGRRMSGVLCRGGTTQIQRILELADREAGIGRLDALVFVGDAFEEEIDRVCGAAGRLALRGVPAFMFQEGRDPVAARAFAEIARITGGVHAHFDEGSADELRRLLRAVAVYASGGAHALDRLARTETTAALLTSRLKAR